MDDAIGSNLEVVGPAGQGIASPALFAGPAHDARRFWEFFTANIRNPHVLIAATAVRTRVGSAEQFPVTVLQFGSAPQSCVGVPTDLGVDTHVYISLYGSGIRGLASECAVSFSLVGKLVPVLYSGVQGTYAGLGQVNINCHCRCEDRAKWM